MVFYKAEIHLDSFTTKVFSAISLESLANKLKSNIFIDDHLYDGVCGFNHIECINILKTDIDVSPESIMKFLEDNFFAYTKNEKIVSLTQFNDFFNYLSKHNLLSQDDLQIIMEEFNLKEEHEPLIKKCALDLMHHTNKNEYAGAEYVL